MTHPTTGTQVGGSGEGGTQGGGVGSQWPSHHGVKLKMINGIARQNASPKKWSKKSVVQTKIKKGQKVKGQINIK